MRVLIAILLISSTTIAAEMRYQRDIRYAYSLQHKLDLYTPTEGNNLPIVVWIHGGGWKRGDKRAVQQKPQAFVDKGFVFISVNYRFIPKVTVKEMTGDIAKAIKWTLDNAERFNGDRKTIFVAGHSAGAHLAALVCTDESYLKAEGLSLSNIKGCIPVDTAVYDIPKQFKSRGRLGSQLYKTAFGEDEKSQQNLSPISHVSKDKGIPPFLILHVASRPDSTEQSQAFAKSLKDAGIKAMTISGEGKTHGTINTELGLPDDEPTKAVFEFLDSALKKK